MAKINPKAIKKVLEWLFKTPERKFPPKTPVIRQIGVRKWELMQDFTFFFERDEKQYQLIIFRGFQYDQASIPAGPLWMLGGIAGHNSEYSTSSLEHDFWRMYHGNANGYRCEWGNRVSGEGELKEKNSSGEWVKSNRIFTIQEVDDIFYRRLLEYGVKDPKATLMRAAVRLTGGKKWKEEELRC